jgi:hypothetical protein
LRSSNNLYYFCYIESLKEYALPIIELLLL